MEKRENKKIVEDDYDTEMDCAAGNAFVAGLCIIWMTGILGSVFLIGLAILIFISWKIGAIVMVASFICWLAAYIQAVRLVPDGY